MVRNIQSNIRTLLRLQHAFMPTQTAQAVVAAIVARGPGKECRPVSMAAAAFQYLVTVALHFPQAQVVQSDLRAQAQEYHMVKRRGHSMAPATD
ncbi:MULTISPECIES: hypothetical protein [Pseudomonas]|uniref:Uncharacterized protein n=3 Tax=Pseudomonas poae TaxID=200451 RepID=A0AAP2S3A4_9PSED|nr:MULTISPECIES: hypothetical protein [Pseudomonas]AGE27045.1 hypothetical protein H045_14900 [Pseudomonas poae RE*1-1-14]KTC41184.1 hypothetical protein AO260_19855 [Pseudomonas sp. ABAC21]KRP47776.1 hypothetical protein TU75_18315 [Pseudomonas poae]MCF5656728.1 hypothetical protein [Pseudomonas poae]MCF5777916.1 hypothetical protein [Pseudomonas poae]